MLKFTIALLLLISCSSPAGYPIDLAFGLKSYMSIKEVQHLIKQRHGDYDIVEDAFIMDKRSKYKYSKIKTTIFKYKGSSGTTILEFFNNQLMSVIFYPKNSKTIYAPDHLGSDPAMIIDHDMENKFYFKWSDKKLEKQFENWLKKYS